MPDEVDAVRVGDKMRFSTALLRAIHQLPEHATHVVRVSAIERDVDGCLKVVVDHIQL